jgi:hypothetical protein
MSFIACDLEVGYGRDITWDLQAKEARANIKAQCHGAS